MTKSGVELAQDRNTVAYEEERVRVEAESKRATIQFASNDPLVRVFIKAIPYKRRKVEVIAGKVTLYNLNWSGGTINYYTVVHLDTGEARGFWHWSNIWPGDNQPREGASVMPPLGFAVVQTGFFCGKASLMRAFINPEDQKRFTPKTK